MTLPDAIAWFGLVGSCGVFFALVIAVGHEPPRSLPIEDYPDTWAHTPDAVFYLDSDGRLGTVEGYGPKRKARRF